MVVFVDLDGNNDGSCDAQPTANRLAELRLRDDAHSLSLPPIQEQGNGNQPKRGDIAAAVGCYPIALSIASHLDLNDLFSLSLTSHRVHDNLSQFSSQLVSHSLRCANASQPLLSEIMAKFRDVHFIRNPVTDHSSASDAHPVIVAPTGLSPPDSTSSSLLHPATPENFRLLQSSKIGRCARDLVGECRRCGLVVCRNCTAKPPSNRYLPDRLRRLCKACLNAPLIAHLRPLQSAEDSAIGDSPEASSGASSVRSFASTESDSQSNFRVAIPRLQTESSTLPIPSAFLRSACSCATRGVYLCNDCGSNLRAADTTYKRVWTWRSRYSMHIGGGLGTGLGEGDQGQKCGRGEYCLELGNKGVCWVEIDCQDGNFGRTSTPSPIQEAPLNPLQQSTPQHNSGHAPHLAASLVPPRVEVEGEDRSRNKPGYHQQEIEGIGGVVKKKVKKKVKVGATVLEFDDERESKIYLQREATGQVRAWCGWCQRVVPARDEAPVADC